MNLVSAERLRQMLSYDPGSGNFTWLNPPKNHAGLKGVIAGNSATGYVAIKIDGRKYKAHRLAWLYVHGEWPKHEIDHRNCCKLDNRIDNLRPATNPQNQANKNRVLGKAVPKGVRLLPSGNFQARISVGRKLLSIGTFADEKQAQEKYFEHSQKHYGEFARAS